VIQGIPCEEKKVKSSDYYGQMYLFEDDRAFVKRIMSLWYTKDDFLSESELEVAKELVIGYTNKKMAEHLYISITSVKTHIINTYGKFTGK
jgi:LuxR family maltose regulon positive regulatory protein